jgi:hypothetical protein
MVNIKWQKGITILTTTVSTDWRFAVVFIAFVIYLTKSIQADNVFLVIFLREKSQNINAGLLLEIHKDDNNL